MFDGNMLSCPFCGSAARNDAHADDCYFVLHAKLQNSGEDMSFMPKVMAAWNRRKYADKPIACMVNGKLLSYKDAPVPDNCDLYDRPTPPTIVEPMKFAAWRRILAEKVDAYIQGESDGEGAGEDAYDDLKAHILTVPVAQPPAEQGAELSDEQIFGIADPFGAFQYGDAQGDKRLAFARAIIAADRAARGGAA